MTATEHCERRVLFALMRLYLIFSRELAATTVTIIIGSNRSEVNSSHCRCVRERCVSLKLGQPLLWGTWNVCAFRTTKLSTSYRQENWISIFAHEHEKLVFALTKRTQLNGRISFCLFSKNTNLSISEALLWSENKHHSIRNLNLIMVSSCLEVMCLRSHFHFSKINQKRRNVRVPFCALASNAFDSLVVFMHEPIEFAFNDLFYAHQSRWTRRALNRAQYMNQLCHHHRLRIFMNLILVFGVRSIYSFFFDRIINDDRRKFGSKID